MVNAIRETHRPDMSASGVRIVNVILGVWLFISAFVWPHTTAARTNTWILGVLITGFAIAAIFVPTIRWAVTACSVWLFFSTLAIHHFSNATRWNNLIVAVIVFFLSLTPSTIGATAGRGVPPPQRA